MGDILVCFSCCVTQQPPRKRRRLDPSMIGCPTNFVHTGHIGAGDIGGASLQINTVEGQMKSKGGYEHLSPVSVNLRCIDVENTLE